MNHSKPCKYILNKENCPFGRRCRFLHQCEEEPSKKKSKSRCDEFKRTSDADGNVEGNVPPRSTEDQALDVKLIQEDEDEKGCNFPPSCQLPNQSQGDCDELSVQKKLNKRKVTPVCRFYLRQGGCKFGEKCRFIHSRRSQVKVWGVVSSVEKPPPRQDKTRAVESSSEDSQQHHPPPLTLASFIGSRPHVQRPRKVDQNNSGNSLREVSMFYLSVYVIYVWHIVIVALGICVMIDLGGIRATSSQISWRQL